MKLRTAPALLVLFVSSFLSVLAADTDTLVRDNTAFALDLYGQLSKEQGNLFFSPYSISAALAMTYAGARGETESEMQSTLHFSLGQEGLHPAFRDLDKGLNRIRRKGNVKLHTANSLWPQDKYPFLESYLKLVRKCYDTEITPLDYANDTEAARAKINTWVEDKTRDRIKDMIPPGVLTDLTRLVLVNAIYFKGSWADRFDPAQTHDMPFQVAAAKPVEMPMMWQSDEFGYGETDDLQILELPYKGDDLSMVVLLPRAADGISGMEKQLSHAKLGAWLDTLRTRDVIVYLPKFTMESSFGLNDVLSELGMPQAFDERRANFAGMDGKRNWLYIGAVLHKAFIEVNEEGTEAAAATAVIMLEKGIAESPPEFRADHPFVFLIREKKSGIILFMGRVADPTA